MDKILKDNKKGILVIFALLSSACFTGGALWYHCIPSLIILIFLFLSHFKFQKITPIILSVALLVLSLTSVFITKGDIQAGVYEFEKFLLFVLAFLCGSSLISADFVSVGTVISSAVISIIGLIAYCGFFGSSELVLTDALPRLQSLFKYANTVACFLSCGYIFALGEYASKQKKLYLKDVTNLRRYLAGGYGVDAIVSSSDLNQDGVVELKDVTLLRRYLVDRYNVGD